jgi:GNAT superfamily N-acetyltransferase
MTLLPIKQIESKDYKRVLQLIKEGMDENILPTTIYYLDKCAEYIKLLLSSNSLISGYYYYGYYHGDELVGFSEWRDLDYCLFLNNIYIDLKYRNKGIGSQLFNQGIDLAKRLQKKTIELDVYSNNNRAIRWYSSLGFVPKIESHVIELDLVRELSTNITYTIINYPQSIKLLNEFGFSYLDINSITGLKKVGLLNHSYFRLNHPNDLEDETLLYTLKTFDPNRKFLCITDNPHIPKLFVHKIIAKSMRLQLHL